MSSTESQQQIEEVVRQLKEQVNEQRERIESLEQHVSDESPIVTSDLIGGDDDDETNRPTARFYIKHFERPREHGAPANLVIKVLTDNGYDEDEARSEIERLRRMGEIYEPVDGYLKTV